MTEEALASLVRYDWPGNVRELKNLIEAILVDAPSRRIAFADLPEQFRRRLRDAEGLPKGERERLLAALCSTRWNKSSAAQKLHWSRMTLYRKMAKYELMTEGKPEDRPATISRENCHRLPLDVTVGGALEALATTAPRRSPRVR